MALWPLIYKNLLLIRREPCSFISVWRVLLNWFHVFYLLQMLSFSGATFESIC